MKATATPGLKTLADSAAAVAYRSAPPIRSTRPVVAYARNALATPSVTALVPARTTIRPGRRRRARRLTRRGCPRVDEHDGPPVAAATGPAASASLKPVPWPRRRPARPAGKSRPGSWPRSRSGRCRRAGYREAGRDGVPVAGLAAVIAEGPHADPSEAAREGEVVLGPEAAGVVEVRLAPRADGGVVGRDPALCSTAS